MDFENIYLDILRSLQLMSYGLENASEHVW